MATHDSNDTHEKPALNERQALQSPEAQEARNASGTEIKASEANRTNASDGSLRDRARLIVEQDESIQIMGMEGLSASRTNKLSERDLTDLRPSSNKTIQIGRHSYDSGQVLANNPVSSDVVADSTNAIISKRSEVPVKYGHVSNLEAEPWGHIAQLPEKTQAVIIATAIKSNFEHWSYDQSERAIGSLIGTVQGIGTILQDMATITDFAAVCLKGDKLAASEMGAQFGESLGAMAVGGVNVLKLSDQYLQSLGGFWRLD